MKRYYRSVMDYDAYLRRAEYETHRDLKEQGLSEVAFNKRKNQYYLATSRDAARNYIVPVSKEPLIIELNLKIGLTKVLRWLYFALLATATILLFDPSDIIGFFKDHGLFLLGYSLLGVAFFHLESLIYFWRTASYLKRAFGLERISKKEYLKYISQK